MTAEICILGCGYVGLELGRQLRAEGHTVHGVRRSDAGLEAVRAAGLEPIQADITDRASLQAVPDVDWLVVAASSGGRSAAAARRTYVSGLRTVIDAFGQRADAPDRLLYTSSTGVYGDRGGGWVDETTDPDPETERGRVLLTAERLALERTETYGIDGTVARFAGLYGPDRYRLDRYLEGPVRSGYLNLVHRDDAAGAVGFLLKTDQARGEVVLVVDNEPVDRRRLARWLADACGVARPETRSIAAERSDREGTGTAGRRVTINKRCSNAKLRALGYELRFPTFRDGYRPAIEACLDGTA